MKEHLVSDKILFFVPLLFTLSMFLIGYNAVFKINGGEYEFLIHEAILASLIVSFLQILLYIALSKIMKNKRIIFVLQVLFFFVLEKSLSAIILFLIVLTFALCYKKENINITIFLEISSAIFTCIAVILCIMNTTKAIYQGIVYNKRIEHYQDTKNITINNDSRTPNIYWIHMDGMPSTGFIKKYYNEPLTDFHNELDNVGFMQSNDASFVGGHHTITALNSLINPNYYDNFLADYLKELDECEINSCRTKKTASYKDLSYNRLDSELINAFKKRGYTTISIAEFNQYTSLNTDYVYDISNYYNDCTVPYFENKYSTQELYKNALKTHFNYVMNFYYGVKMQDNEFYEKYIDCNVDLNNYPIIKKSKYLPAQMTITALNDAKGKGKNAKFYFIDSRIIHRHWIYDKNGKIIRKDNTDLDDYDDTYVYATKVLLETIKYIKDTDKHSVIVVQGDHGIHVLSSEVLKSHYNIDDREVLNIRNSTISLISVPEEYQNGDEEYLSNPLNISRYLINNYVGENYNYLKNADKK